MKPPATPPLLQTDAGPDTWTASSDGSAVPNPGRMGVGAVLVAPDGRRYTLSQVTRDHGCNNEAEARAVAWVLAEARGHGATVLRLQCDNSLVVQQLSAADPPPVARLQECFDALRAQAAGFAALTVVWVPRHRNGEADALARAALGLGPKAGPTPKQLRRGRRR